MAVVGENGVGKSTVIQAAASVYSTEGSGKDRFASDFFPDTTWDQVRAAEIRYSIKQGEDWQSGSVRKPTGRWRGNPERPKRSVTYIDLSRVQPIPYRVGYSKLANPALTESGSKDFDSRRLGRFSSILGRPYSVARMATAGGDANRKVPVVRQNTNSYSGFHQGAGETTVVELLGADLPKYGLVLIDEVESSLHPRAQRRLIRDLAERCRELELQIVLTTHSPYVLEELPEKARAHIFESEGTRQVVYGVSPEFAMSKMDDIPHPECDLYVEDDRAGVLLTEILTRHEPSLVQRCRVTPSGAASVVQTLGLMISQGRFHAPACAFLDGDKSPAPGCAVLPGGDAPERVVFEGLQEMNWRGLDTRVARSFPDVVDACNSAMTLGNHHDWTKQAAVRLTLGGDVLWQAMCSAWVENRSATTDDYTLAQVVSDALAGIDSQPVTIPPSRLPAPQTAASGTSTTNPIHEPPAMSDVPQLPFGQ
jgi:predicted ATPase